MKHNMLKYDILKVITKAYYSCVIPCLAAAGYTHTCTCHVATTRQGPLIIGGYSK